MVSLYVMNNTVLITTINVTAQRPSMRLLLLHCSACMYTACMSVTLRNTDFYALLAVLQLGDNVCLMNTTACLLKLIFLVT